MSERMAAGPVGWVECNKKVFTVEVAAHQAVADEVLERRLIEKGSCEHSERIEPASGLVNALRDEVCRERALESLFILKRVMCLQLSSAWCWCPGKRAQGR